ncbi:hypothetical protein PROFUN_10173 [Planoprotostelium fungivorum]|uniref:TATA box binding protein associated factor (TAF) histone-like fold domain-containing protein n=1 Tax=Planoprotostelium fungivorum TaxID=1890364 RepID=A0A2P6NEL1_9EUKA|nr:hypothetical protein PROFUN_10173 [Planoprotostelium fungivorum]
MNGSGFGTNGEGGSITIPNGSIGHLGQNNEPLLGLTPATIRSIASANGHPNLSNEVAKALCPEVEYRMREIIQEASKFMRHSKRSKLSVEDVNHSLRLKSVEALYGFSASKEPLHLTRMVQSNSNNVVYSIEDKELDFDEIINAPPPKCPQDHSLGIHWLAVDGVQPHIPQNPTPAKRDANKKNQNATKVVPLVKHTLSKELQLYFEKVKTTLLDGNAKSIDGVLDLISKDSGIHHLVPYLTKFVFDQVHAHLRDLDTLMVLMRLSRSLVINEELNVEPYVHQLMPAICTCMVGKRLCAEPTENHWALRDYSASLVLLVCERFGRGYPAFQPRVTKTLVQAFCDPSKPLTTHYGAIKGLSVFGPQVVETSLIPHLKDYVPKLQPKLESKNLNELNEAKRVKTALLECVGKYIYQMSKNGGGSGGDYEELRLLFGDSLLPYCNLTDTNLE